MGLHLVHVLAALVVALAAGWLGRTLARLCRQPSVIGEIVVGLLAGPLVIAILGRPAFDLLLPAGVFGTLKTIAEAALVLFLVGVTHEMRLGDIRAVRGAIAWVFAGAFVLPMLAGAALAAWIVLSGHGTLRGDAPGPAFFVYLMVALAITAVPVLARILADHRTGATAEGRLALSSAMVIDIAGWLVLSVAIALNAGSVTGFLRAMGVFAGAAVVALVIRRLLATSAAATLAERSPVGAAVLLGVLAIAIALTIERLGLTAIFGAVLTGLAVPVSWGRAVTYVRGAGLALAPVFFVVTGIGVVATPAAATGWAVIVLAILLGTVSKVGGGYLGARLGRQSRPVAARVGVYVNTRGMTELIVLQAGLKAGLLTGPLFLALVVMAVVTTLATGPGLALLDKVLPVQRSRRPTSQPR